MSSKLCLALFYLHLLLIIILITFLTIRGLLSLSHNHHFHPLHWYPPLLTSTGCSAVVAIAWQAATRSNPSTAIKAAFWLSPSLTFATGILLLFISSNGSFVAAAFALIFSLIQSLYSCWVAPRFDHATRILSVSLSAPATGATSSVITLIIAGMTFACFALSGIGGASATSTRFDILFTLLILLSLSWAMHVTKNIPNVAISRVCYNYFANRVDTRVALLHTLKESMGSVCLGSFLVPVLAVVRGSARAMILVAGDRDEFMFSCADCYASIAGRLIAYGNRWGFVHVGVYNKGFVRASADTWEMFQRVGMLPLIDSDITGSFCFLCGVVGGAVSTLVGGSWALRADKEYATEVSIYAFLIGYFMSRIAMSWPQACVSAYYVAYSESPQSPRFDSTIPERIQQLQTYRR